MSEKDPQALKRESLHIAYKRTFVDDPEGAKVLEDLVARHYDREVFVKGAPDETAYNAGRRATVAYILKILGQVQGE